MSQPIQIRMGGYGPTSTCFSQGLKFIGERLTSEFGPAVDVKAASPGPRYVRGPGDKLALGRAKRDPRWCAADPGPRFVVRRQPGSRICGAPRAGHGTEPAPALTPPARGLH
jgi:hypothetical protein